MQSFSLLRESQTEPSGHWAMCVTRGKAQTTKKSGLKWINVSEKRKCMLGSKWVSSISDTQKDRREWGWDITRVKSLNNSMTTQNWQPIRRLVVLSSLSSNFDSQFLSFFFLCTISFNKLLLLCLAWNKLEKRGKSPPEKDFWTRESERKT